MSALGQKQTYAVQNGMSDLAPKADIGAALALEAPGVHRSIGVTGPKAGHGNDDRGVRATGRYTWIELHDKWRGRDAGACVGAVGVGHGPGHDICNSQVDDGRSGRPTARSRKAADVRRPARTASGKS